MQIDLMIQLQLSEWDDGIFFHVEKKNWDWKARYTTYLTIRDHVTVVHASVTSIECGRHVGNYYVTIRLKRWSFSFLSSSINHTISTLLSLSFSTYIYIYVYVYFLSSLLLCLVDLLIDLSHARTHTLSLSLFLSCYVIYDQNILWIVNVIKICVFSFFFYFIYISLYIEII